MRGHEVREPLLARVARQVRVVERRLAERLRRQLERRLQEPPASLLVGDLGPVTGEVVVDAVVVGGIIQAAAEGLPGFLAPAEAMEDQAEGGVRQSGFRRELDRFFGVVQRLAGPAELREAERFAPYRADAARLERERPLESGCAGVVPASVVEVYAELRQRRGAAPGLGFGG